MSDIAGEVEAVLGEMESIFRLHGEPIPFSHSSSQQPFEFWVRCQFEGGECDYESPRSADRDAAYVHHRAHLAEQIAALIARNDLTAFLAALPADVFSEHTVGLIREWADEWRTGGGEG